MMSMDSTEDHQHDALACRDFEAAGASRRKFLSGMLGSVGSLGVLMASESVFAQAAFGSTTGGNVVVLLSQRGGADGLSLVVPHGDPWYYKHRPSMNIPKANVLGLDSMFGLHPALAPLLPWYRAKKMGIVHAAGMATPNRSHFEAMAVVEQAAPGTSIRTGWINRMIGLDAANDGMDAVQLGSAQAPASLLGPAPSLSLPDLNNAGWDGWITKDSFWRPAMHDAYRAMWAGYSGRGATAASSAFSAQDKLLGITSTNYTPANGAVYPTGSLGSALKQAARLIKADVGTKVITIDHGSWDMHANLGDLASGSLRDKAGEWAKALAAFLKDLGATMSRVTVLSMTEFGRRVKQNGSRGADHGWGQVMFALGAGVRGGRVYGHWPGLAPTQLANGDLRVTTDYRHVLAEVMRYRMHVDPARLLPGFTARPIGLIG